MLRGVDSLLLGRLSSSPGKADQRFEVLLSSHVCKVWTRVIWVQSQLGHSVTVTLGKLLNLRVP